MLERVDRVQLVVKDRQAAARTFGEVLGAQPVRNAPSAHLGAERLVLVLGSSEVELGERFGYVGTLAMFNPKDRLDRIEVSQVTNATSAMGRWVARRGDSLYMCYVEADDVRPIIERLAARGGRFATRGSDPVIGRDGLWVHPSALCGLLLGISRTTVGWGWSGQPTRVARP